MLCYRFCPEQAIENRYKSPTLWEACKRRSFPIPWWKCWGRKRNNQPEPSYSSCGGFVSRSEDGWLQANHPRAQPWSWPFHSELKLQYYYYWLFLHKEQKRKMKGCCIRHNVSYIYDLWMHGLNFYLVWILCCARSIDKTSVTISKGWWTNNYFTYETFHVGPEKAKSVLVWYMC